VWVNFCPALWVNYTPAVTQLKYASAKPINTDNEKYAFRTWLIRLGMTGNEYKSTRKLLLQNLSGNGAFRKPGEGYEA
jgi:hypothetical protein